MELKKDIEIPLIKKKGPTDEDHQLIKSMALGIDENKLPGLYLGNDGQKEGHQKVELFLSCKGLANKDKMSLSDPQIDLWAIDSTGQPQKIGSTEIIKDNLNPEFQKTFRLDFKFEKMQKIRFNIKDIDDKHGNFDALGVVNTCLGDIMGSKDHIAVFDILLQGQKAGKLNVKAEIIEGGQVSVKVKVRGNKIRSSGCCVSGSSFRISRQAKDGSKMKVYESAVINSSDPDWQDLEIDSQTLCNFDPHRSLTFETVSTSMIPFFEPCVVGFGILTLADIVGGKKDLVLKEQSNANADVGKLHFDWFKLEKKASFLEYLRGGIQINVVIAIDYTGSNGDPSRSDSLHSIKDGQLNDYQKAISGVCEILLCYDYDKKVRMYGFGGEPKGMGGAVSHCFPIAGDDNEVLGLDGIMATYQNSLKNIELSGPTYFAQIMRNAKSIAQIEKRNGSTIYTIQLILTDGMIHDMQPTIDEIVACTDLPLSFIIVGVGNADFSSMEILDADNTKLVSSRQEESKRDIVQFVPFRDFGGNKERLAEQLLAEVPSHFIDYMSAQGIQPLSHSK